MIPKKIHYCWLSNEEMPEEVAQCVNSWKKLMPDYEYVLWNRQRFNAENVPFVKEAIEAGRWAFASDFIRLYAVYSEGGVYLDSDVYTFKRFDDFLHHGFFSSIEYNENIVSDVNTQKYTAIQDDLHITKFNTGGIGIQAAIFGAVKGHPFLKTCLDWYKTKHFKLEDNSYFDTLLAPAIYAHLSIPFGFKYKNELQVLSDGITIYPSFLFAGNISELDKSTYAVHLCLGNWRDKSLLTIFKEKLSNYTFLRILFGKKPFRKKSKLNQVKDLYRSINL